MIRVLIVLVLLLLFPIAPAHAAYCRSLDGHNICIVDLQRSAKHYWEYRAIVSVDGTVRPVEVYNCRDRTLTRHNGTRISFAQEPASQIVCRLYRA